MFCASNIITKLESILVFGNIELLYIFFFVKSIVKSYPFVIKIAGVSHGFRVPYQQFVILVSRQIIMEMTIVRRQLHLLFLS